METDQEERQASLSEILDLAEAVGLVFRMEGAEKPISRLIKLTREYWTTLREDAHEERFSFVMRLLWVCPVLYQRPPGLEWVTDYLKSVTQMRKLNPDLDCKLWEAEKKVYRMYHMGRKRNVPLDYIRRLKVEVRMNTVAPGKDGGLLFTQDVNKSQAVSWVGETEAVGKDLRPIWRSLERLERRYSKLTKILLDAGFRPKNL